MFHYKGWSYPELFEIDANNYIGNDDNIIITLDGVGTKILSPLTRNIINKNKNREEFFKETIEKYIDNLNK